MKAIERLAGRIGNFPVELPAALLAAAAVAFLAGIAPDWRLERMVGATGVGRFVSAAQPPLGDTARLLMALAGATLTFVLVWTGLRALEPRDRLPQGYPAFRREDLHPDAPRRRPILAGEEFGAPDVLDLREPLPDEIAAVAAAPLPSFLQPGPEPVIEPDEPMVARAEATGDVLDPAPEPDLPSESNDAMADPASNAAPDLSRLARAMEAVPVPSTTPIESVPELMARLERGLASRGPVPVAPVANEDTEAALRAIADELRQVARAR